MNQFQVSAAEPIPDSQSPAVKLKVLMVEDNAIDCEFISRALSGDGQEIEAEVVQTAAEFLLKLRARRPDIVLADYNLPQWHGMGALAILRQEGLDIPLILVSGAL